jgi:hypothetical protein
MRSIRLAVLVFALAVTKILPCVASSSRGAQKTQVEVGEGRRGAACQVCPFTGERRVFGQVWQPALRPAPATRDADDGFIYHGESFIIAWFHLSMRKQSGL